MKSLRCLTAALILGVLSCGSPSAPSGQQHNNSTSVTLALGGSNPVSQLDTISLVIGFSPGDRPGDPLYLEISFDGSLPAVDSLSIPPFDPTDPTQTPVSLSGYVIIPSGLPDGQLTFSAVLPIEGDTSRAVLAVQDARSPFIGGAYIAPGVTPNAFAFDYQSNSSVIDLVAGATDSVVISAADNHSVAWLGWGFGAPSNARDSVAVTGAGVQASIPFTVPASLAGATPSFYVFARDSDGNMAADSFGTVTVAPFVHHPVRTAAVDSAMNDIAYDAKRKVLYLSEPGHANVLVLSLASMTFQSPITLPAAPAGLDLSPSGDSLVVALANTGDLAFVTLTGTPTTTVHHLTSLDSVSGDSTTIPSTARYVRVAADGRVIVATYRIVDHVESGALLQYDLSTGRDTLVFPSSVASLARSGDATRVLMSGVVDGILASRVYDGVAHQYSGPENAALPQSGMWLSVNQNGTSFLMGNALYDANLTGLGVLEDDNELTTQGYGSAISDTGTTVWLGGAGGGCQSGGGTAPCAPSAPGFYFRFRVPVSVRSQEGQLIEVADAPQGVVQLVALRGDSTLIGVGPTEIMAFDLTTSTPGSVSSRVATHTLRPRVRTTSVRAGSSLDFRVRLRGKTRSLRFTQVTR